MWQLNGKMKPGTGNLGENVHLEGSEFQGPILRMSLVVKDEKLACG